MKCDEALLPEGNPIGARVYLRGENGPFHIPKGSIVWVCCGQHQARGFAIHVALGLLKALDVLSNFERSLRPTVTMPQLRAN